LAWQAPLPQQPPPPPPPPPPPLERKERRGDKAKSRFGHKAELGVFLGWERHATFGSARILSLKTGRLRVVRSFTRWEGITPEPTFTQAYTAELHAVLRSLGNTTAVEHEAEDEAADEMEGDAELPKEVMMAGEASTTKEVPADKVSSSASKEVPETSSSASKEVPETSSWASKEAPKRSSKEVPERSSSSSRMGQRWDSQAGAGARAEPGRSSRGGGATRHGGADLGGARLPRIRAAHPRSGRRLRPPRPRGLLGP
jgi:hypothetical protein